MGSALEKLKAQRGTVKTGASKKAKTVEESLPITAKAAKAAHTNADEDAALPTAEDIEAMKAGELDDFHGTLPEPLDGWEDLDKKGKKAALIEALYAEDADETPGIGHNGGPPLEEDALDNELSGGSNVTKLGAKKKGSKIDANDLIAVSAQEIENLTEDKANNLYWELSESSEFNYFKIGGVLAVIREKKFFGKYESFKEKVEAEFGMKVRKAEYMIELYNDIVASEVPWEKLKGIGWTKLKEISHLIDNDNIDEWAEKCKSMNIATLIAEVKALNPGQKIAVGKPVTNSIKTMSFRLHEDQQELVNEAFEKAEEAAGTDVKAVLLSDVICSEYLASGKTKVVTKQETIDAFYKRVLKEHDDDVEQALRALLEGPEFEAVFGLEAKDIDWSE
jgi:hypothetical protein